MVGRKHDVAGLRQAIQARHVQAQKGSHEQTVAMVEQPGTPALGGRQRRQPALLRRRQVALGILAKAGGPSRRRAPVLCGFPKQLAHGADPRGRRFTQLHPRALGDLEREIDPRQ